MDTGNISAPFQGLRTHMGLYLDLCASPLAAQGCTDRTLTSCTAGAGFSATHPNPVPCPCHPPHPLFGCFPYRFPVLQLHLAGCTGNWMRLKPRSWGKGKSMNKSSEAGLRAPTGVRCCPVPCRGSRNKGSKIKARPLGQPRAAVRKLKGEKGPSHSTWKQV